MNPRRWGMIIAIVCIAVAVAALDIQNAFHREPQAEQLTPGAAPLAPVGGPDGDFDILPQNSFADHALLLEPAEPDVDTLFSPASAGPSAPAELPQAEPPAHVPLMSDARRAAIEAVIRRHLPWASDHERRCWLEETCGLSAAQVEELLQLRTQLGPLVPPHHEFDRIPAAERPHTSNAGRILMRARRIVLGNLLNADSVGYRAAEITFVANGAEHGESVPAIASTTISPAQGELIATGRSLDVAVEGEGFLQVNYDGQTCLTRFGRLTIGADRKLALDVAGPAVLPSPEIEIPSGTEAVRILDSGRVEVERSEKSEWLSVGMLTLVEVPFPERLRPAEAGTYSATPQSGEPLKIAAGTESGSVFRPGMLEKSNVDRDAELQRLKRLDWLREQLGRAEDMPTD